VTSASTEPPVDPADPGTPAAPGSPGTPEGSAGPAAPGGNRRGRSPAAAAAALERLAARLGYEFRDGALLDLALTHRSFCAEHPGHVSNERLEFLGDAVLGMVVTDHIFTAYPHMPEGELAKLRASVVSAAALAELAGELDLGSAVRLGKGEAASGGGRKPSILADALEAVLGAVYLDGGMDAVRPLVRGLLDGRILAAAAGPGGHDFKTQLQELAARHFEELPAYSLRDEGPDHEKRFFATVYLGGEPQGAGEGRSKKQAEQSAAHAAWGQLVRRFAEAGAAGRAAAGEGENESDSEDATPGEAVSPGDDRPDTGDEAVGDPPVRGSEPASGAEASESGTIPMNPAGSESIDA
jgi:ribonuclease-3